MTAYIAVVIAAVAVEYAAAIGAAVTLARAYVAALLPDTGTGAKKEQPWSQGGCK
ncbi:hypothetical protein [Ralstonia sp.]|uniref:hypothetical protein n=1 Tax=Ralstonia sp. TaxID=54061 RepID=UPI0031E042AB